MLNRVILIGRLTRDPELRYTPAGVAVAQFTLAVDRPFSRDNGGEREREADFIPVVTWRQLAETCANYLRKGRLAAVEGRIQVRNYENNEGRRIYVTEVIADNVRFLESANRDGGGQGQGSNDFGGGGFSGGSGGGYSGGGSRSSGSRSSGSNVDPFADDGKPIDISDDDLPF
ncbi:single-stranded DNA-binding protein [Cohnella lubricantis]|uniref:Single-stranded DNA-binding protein n=1 Tax=Cohnella lubricantis TaxID=2163172 RepID=A0A841TH02_9BACL|nr:single-stranded DNA-binding protein [Cohnella lubricantis]MBB6678227.1 single-stranded DNA-binding protein [Cohnella lubricantis]MBP2120082.1 single-strand DNA-binding protein [Cohnella lubricantis]